VEGGSVNKDAQTAREIWTEVIEQVPKLPPETFATVITGLPPVIRKQVTGAHPTIRKALELLGETIRTESNPEFTAQAEMSMVFGYALDTLLEAAWEQLQPWDKEKSDKPAIQKPPKALDAFATLQGLGRFSNQPWMHDYYGGQMQAGKDWEEKGIWQKNTQGDLIRRKEYKGGGTSTAIIRALDDADAMNARLQQEVLERLGPFTLDVSLAFTAALCDPRNKVYPLKGAVLVTTEMILSYKKFQQRGERREEAERKVEQAVKDLQRYRLSFNQVKIDKREAITIPQARLFDIQEVIREQQEIDGTWTVIEKGWWVRPGIWEQFFLTDNQRLWFSYGAIEALQLSHCDNRPVDQITKLLWVELFICPAGTWHTEGPKDVQIGPLLERTGLLLKPEHRSKDWYWKLRANVEAAATQLITKGAIVTWEYLPGCPLPLDQSPGAAQAWLDSIIRFKDPATVAASERKRLPATAQKRAELEDQARASREARGGKQRNHRTRKAQPPAPTEPITAATWKRWRNERGIQQSEAARRLGVDQSFISLIERGKRLISPELAARLRALMDSPEGVDQ
jgi:DNA-binding XRE family transcriptional regulator